MDYLPLATGLPPILGGISADLQRLFAAPLKEYVQTVSSRNRRPGAKIINDSIWKTVRLEPWEVLVLDSPILQRLRNVAQLGLARLVFPGAGYSRFEHSLGALRQAQRVLESLNHNARAARRGLDPVRPSDETLIRLAALLHDIGHGFLSHVSERAISRITELPGGGSAAEAVRAARQLFKCRKNPALAEVIAALIIRLPEFVLLLDAADVPYWEDAEDLSLHLAHLVVGSTLYSTRPFLSEIISGAVDADKLDYMARDCHMAGLPMPVDVERLLQKIHAVGVPATSDVAAEYVEHYNISANQTVYMFAVDLPGGKTVEEMVVGRVLLYAKLYHHQKVRAFEGTIDNVLRALQLHLPAFRLPSTYLRLSDSDFLSGHWGEDNKSQQVRGAKAEVASVVRRAGLVRAIAFGPTLIKKPMGVEDAKEADKAIRRLWRKLKPLVLRQAEPNQSEEFKRAVLKRARQYLREDGQFNLADALSELTLVIDLPDVQGIAEKTRFWFGSEDTGLELYSNVARVERWAEAYENERSIGYVFCPPEHVAAVHLAVRDEIYQRTGAELDSRELTLTKVNGEIVQALAKRLVDRGVAVRAVSAVSSEKPLTRPARVELEHRYGERIAELAQRFQSYQPATGSRIDTNLILDWLLQFPRDDVKYAMTILQHIQYWNRQAFADAFKASIEQWFHDRQAVQLVALGGPTTSAVHLKYIWNDVRGAGLSVDLRVLDSLDDLSGGTPLIFYDDYIGSGGQSRTVLQQWSGRPREEWIIDESHVDPLEASVLDRIKQCQVHFLFAAGRRRGLSQLLGTAKALWNAPVTDGLIVAPRDLDCFRPAAGVFDRADEAAHAKSVFEWAGRLALSDKSAIWGEEKTASRILGYGNSGDLSLFYYNAPSSTLTALWKQCEVAGSNWLALFPRREREPASPAIERPAEPR